MKILGIINKDSPVAYHRITMPLLLMDDVEVLITNNITEATFEQGFDIVFYSRHVNDYAFNQLNVMRKKYGFKLIVDIDDYWILDKWHCMYEEYMKYEYDKIQVQHMENADAVFVTHERLYNEAVDYNDNTYIVPNAVPQAGQFAVTSTEPSDKVRLFWQGSVMHEEDINLIRYAIENVGNARKDKIEMVLAGFHPEEPIWVRIARMYTLNKRLHNKLFVGMTYETYYKTYSHADVCLVPLVNSRFNSMKSNLKVLEAANLSLPVIAHHVNPYLDLPIRYANGTMDWARAMRYYIDNENARYDDGFKLNEFCNTWFNYNYINQIRKDIFHEIREQSNIRQS